MRPLRPGDRAAVTVAATSANLGPGFDALGLALDLRDRYEVLVTEHPGVTVTSAGECAGELPTTADHLVARAFLAGLARAGHEAPGIALTCTNVIPQGRGLGSSAAAIVGGLALAGAATDHQAAPALVQAATDIEGHPDNVAAAALGGLTVSWMRDGAAQAVSLPVHPDIRLVLFVPSAVSPTSAARAALPATVPHAHAAANAGRAALLVAAMTREPALLFDATEDWLHQEQRRATYPQAMTLLDDLRAEGLPAVVSGAGPAVLVLTNQADAQAVVAREVPGYEPRAVAVGAGVQTTPPARIG